MARLSNVIRALEEYPDGLEITECIMCGKRVKKGGFWSGHVQVTICTNSVCIDYLLHLAIDSLYDNGWRHQEEKFDRLQTWLRNSKEVYLLKESLEDFSDKKKLNR